MSKTNTYDLKNDAFILSMLFCGMISGMVVLELSVVQHFIGLFPPYLKILPYCMASLMIIFGGFGVRYIFNQIIHWIGEKK